MNIVELIVSIIVSALFAYSGLQIAYARFKYTETKRRQREKDLRNNHER